MEGTGRVSRKCRSLAAVMMSLLKGLPVMRGIVTNVSRIIWTIRRMREKRALARCRTSEELFTLYWRRNVWGDPESVSGSGSTAASTTALREALPELIRVLKVGSLLDAPCGDFNWFRLIRHNCKCRYIGADIVASLVEINQSQYSDSNTTFLHCDITKDVLPHVDLWLCRECLVHFSVEDIWRVIGVCVDSRIEYFLTTIHVDCSINADIRTGSFRPLDLRKPPFSFCEPLLLIDDSAPDQPNRRLGLWNAGQLRAAIEQRCRSGV